MQDERKAVNWRMRSQTSYRYRTGRSVAPDEGRQTVVNLVVAVVIGSIGGDGRRLPRPFCPPEGVDVKTVSIATGVSSGSRRQRCLIAVTPSADLSPP